jgi:succinate dehydrogenase / fumarate reductase cytochrome b subunit
MHYRWHLGYVAWLLNRITGVAITAYLVMHIWVIHNLTKGPEGFDRVMAFVQQPLFKLAEIGLLGVILYHAMNGIRLLWIEWGGGARHHKKAFWWVMGIGFALFLFGAYPIFLSAVAGGAHSAEVIR